MGGPFSREVLTSLQKFPGSARRHPDRLDAGGGRLRSGYIFVVAVFALLAFALFVQSPSARADISGTPDSGTVGADGRVWDILRLGNQVYLAGDFTHVDGVARDHLASINASTGQLTNWAPDADGSVRTLAASADEGIIYAGGGFTHINGVYRGRVAAIDASNGTLKSSWNAGTANSTVRTIVVEGNHVYLGGDFTTLKKGTQQETRDHLALVDGTTGSLDPGWNPSANNNVWSLTFSSDGSIVYTGGDFTSVSGQARPYLAALDSSTGAVDSWQPSTPNGRVMSIVATSGRVYTGEGGPGGAVEAYNVNTANLIWSRDAVGPVQAYKSNHPNATALPAGWSVKGDGDVQAITLMGGKVYAGGHFIRFAGQSRRYFAAVDASTGALDPNWAPMGSGAVGGLGVWAYEPDPTSGKLYAGGDFTGIDGASYPYFARFTDPQLADTTPPETTIDSGPSGTTKDSSATFGFSSSESGSTFECSLDGAAFSSCSSPQSYSNLADGQHTFQARATDTAGNTDSTPAARDWNVDTSTAPVAQPPEQSFVRGMQMGTSGARVRLTWSGSGNGSLNYELEQSTNGGPYEGVWLPQGDTSKTRLLSPGDTYQFRVRATDSSGNVGDWAYGPRFAVDAQQEGSGAVSYAGNWTQQSDGSAYGGALKYSGTQGDTATFTFTGRNIAWIAPKDVDRGRAGVWIDGTLIQGVDMYNSTSKARLVAFNKSWSTPGTHTIEIKVRGSKSAASSGTRIDVDSFIVLE